MAAPEIEPLVDLLPGPALTKRAIRNEDVSDDDAFALALRPQFESLSDVKFIVGQTTVEEVHAHRLILARRSDYFLKTLLRRNDAHNRNPIRTKTFRILNMEPGGFRLMLGYLYNKKIDLPANLPDGTSQIQLLLETLTCSRVLNDMQLETACIDLLMERLVGMPSGPFGSHSGRKQKVLEFIGSNIYHFMWTEASNEFSEKALTALLEFNGWYLPEYQIFEAVVKWARNKHWVEAGLDPGYVDIPSETLRGVMGSTLRGIRFPLMSVDEQREIALKYPGLLTDRERLQLYDYMLILQSGEAPPFTARERRPMARPDPPDAEIRPDANSNQEENGQNQNEQDVINTNENHIAENNQEEIRNGNEQDETGDASTYNVEPNLNDESAAIEPTQRDQEQGQVDDDMSGTGPEQSESSVALPQVLPESSAKDHEFKAPPPKKSKQSTPMPSTSKAVLPVWRQDGSLEGDAADEGNQGQPGEEITSLQNYVASLMGTNLSTLTVINLPKKFSVPKHRIDLPCLKSFNLALETNRHYETGPDLKTYIANQSTYLHRLLFFEYDDSDGHTQLPKGQGDYQGIVLGKILSHIFNHRINVCIKISDVQVLKICHETGTLCINTLRKSQLILDSCTGSVEKFTLKKLELNECVIASLDDIPTADLETVTMRQVKGPNNKQGNLLKDATNMKEFVILGSNACCGNLDLHEDLLQGMPQLQKLCLSRCTLHIKNDMNKFKTNVQELFLDDVVASPAVYSVFPNIFHNVRKLCLYGKNVDPECLYWILHMPSIEFIFGWDFVYSKDAPSKSTPKLEELYNFLARVFDEPFATDFSTPFLMQRKQQFPEPMDHRDWVGTKIETEAYEKFQEEVFQSELLEAFFHSLERFQFFIKPKEANCNGETVRVLRSQDYKKLKGEA